MLTLKLAIVQWNAVPNHVAANLCLALQAVEQAHRLGADLLLFPELWSNGYAPPFEGAFENPFDPAFEQDRSAWLENALTLDSDYVKTLQSAAKQFHIGIVATYLSKTATKPQNTAIVIDKTGSLLLKYAKVHTCDFSLEALLQSGTDFPVCEFDGVQIGVMICYDREFPESARVLMLQGAELILVPNACAMNPARLNQLHTRAFENMVGVAMANYPAVGWGNSCAFSPCVFDQDGCYRDTTILLAPDSTEGLFLAEFDLDQIRAYRKTETWGNAYRKPATYAALLSEEVKEPFCRALING